MKIFKRSFFNIFQLNIIIASMFLNQLIASNSIPGRKIKKQKTYEKQLIKKNILKTVSNFLDISADKYIALPKSPNISNLSQSAQDRYNLENNFIQGLVQVNNKNVIEINEKNNIDILPFLQKNIFIINYLVKNNIFSDSLSYNIALLLLNKYIAQGNNIKESLAQVSSQIKKYSIHFEGIIQLLQNLRKNNDFFDDTVIRVLHNTLLYNGSDKIEIDRAINRFYNYANREPVLLIIQQYKKNDFTIKENNTTYGELNPSKDIYQKLIHDKNKLEDTEMRDYFQLLRRDISDKKPIKISYYLVNPKIKSNIVEYMTINKEEQTETKIETILNNLDSNYFYSLSIISEKELNYLF